MEIPPLNTPITVNLRNALTGTTAEVPGILRGIFREPGAVYIDVELTGGPDDGGMVNIRLYSDGIPDESRGFAESDDAGEDWKGHA